MAPRRFLARKKRWVDGSAPSPFCATDFEETPKKAGKPKRKRAEPLTEISANVPRGGNRRPGRNTLAESNRVPHIKLEYECDTGSEKSPSLGSFRNSHDIFQDDDGGPGMLCLPAPNAAVTDLGICEDRPFATPTHQDRK